MFKGEETNQVDDLLQLHAGQLVATALGDDSVPAHVDDRREAILGLLRPMMLFSGSPWDDPTSTAHIILKSALLDMFKGEETCATDLEVELGTDLLQLHAGQLVATALGDDSVPAHHGLYG
jgi:hypothetical protein